MDLSWEDAQTFLAVAETGSFTAAARSLTLGQPTISRRIALLEESLGCRLFRRGKTGAELTEEGGRLLGAAREMARWAGEFQRVAEGSAEEPEGVVRVAAPPGLAVEVLAPFARLVSRELPGITLEVLASVDYVDLARGPADLALRTQAPTSPGLAVLGEIEVELGVFAAPSYASRLAGRETPAELDWITWAPPYTGVSPRPFLERTIPGFSPVFASDSYLVQKSAVLAGVGVMVLERHLNPFAPGPELVELDVGMRLPPGRLYLVSAKSSRWIPRVRALADLLISQLPSGSPVLAESGL